MLALVGPGRHGPRDGLDESRRTGVPRTTVDILRATRATGVTTAEGRVAAADALDRDPALFGPPEDARTGRGALAAHSHSMVPGGLLVTSRVTRLTSRTSLVMRVEIRASTS
jgi:hypothetical protein